MRKRYRVLVLAALAAALVVPVGFALSLEAPLRVGSETVVSASLFESVPDGAKLFVAGAALVGLAAFVRKAV